MVEHSPRMGEGLVSGTLVLDIKSNEARGGKWPGR